MKALSRSRWFRRPGVPAFARVGAALILTAGAGAAVTVSIDDLEGAPGAQVVARVVVDQAAAVAGGTFRLVLPEFATVETPSLTADTSGFLIASRAGPGQLTVSLARAAGLPEGPAAVFTFPVRISRDAPQGAFTLAWQTAQLYDQAASLVETRVSTGTLTVLPAPVDLDGDGLPDQWELEHLRDLATGPDDDPDADGASNYAELVAGTDPASPESVLLVTALPLPGQNGEPVIALDWEGQPGRSYHVYWSAGPLGPGALWSPVYQPVYQLEGARYRWIDDGTRTHGVPLTESERYYQVRAELP